MAKWRIFNIMQYEKHPETGEVLLTEDKIKIALAHRTVKRWAYICHDKDVYSALDEEQNPDHEEGQTKPRHWHIVIECGTSAIEIGVIAKWFGIADNFVETAKGAGAFLDCVQYLTHEGDKQQGLGKKLYADEEVHANFDFRAELNKRADNNAKFGRDLNERDSIRYRVLYLGLTLRQLCVENPLAYQNDYSTLDKFRYKYITDRAEMPKTRINYYVCGRGGIGKGLICKAIARSLYPNLKDDDDIFFEVGAKGVPFDGYDGQPVIIWNDRRSVDLLEELGGRGNVFNVFDTHPTKGKQNVKYASVNLCNEVNIVNSVEPYKDFLDGLVADYDKKRKKKVIVEDKGQSYRRFPMIIPLHEEDFDLLMNRGFYYGTKEYDQYIEYNNIRGNMQRIAEICGANEKLAHELQCKSVAPVAEKHNELLEKFSKEQTEEEKIRAMFADVGQVGKVVGNGHYINGEFVIDKELEEVSKKNAVVEAVLEYEKSKVEAKMSSSKFDEYDDDYLKNMFGNLMVEVRKKKGVLGNRNFFADTVELIECKLLIDEFEVPYIVGESKDVSLALQIRSRFINKIGFGKDFDSEEKVALKHLFKVQDSAKFWIENKDTDYRELVSPLLFR